MQSFEFDCATCGERHVGIPSFGWDWPIQYLMVPEAERGRRVELGPDHCIIDRELYFVRGCLEIPVAGHDEPLSWGAWVSLSAQSFERCSELWLTPGRENEPPYFGWLNTFLSPYPDTINLRTRVHTRPVGQRPAIELEPTDHPLAVEQREGITFDRVRAITERVLHGED